MKTSLVIMAAGIGSRFGKGIKQLEKVGPNGEIIMDYSIIDAKKAGFDKVIFIIRRDIEKDFKEIIGNRIEKIIECEYAFQEIDDVPLKYRTMNRTKPWGTGHAILAAAPYIHEPFAVINADDYYGPEGFVKIHDYLISHQNDYDYCMAGYLLTNTLSENGGVTRGVCKLNDKDELISIKESYHVEKKGDSIISDNNPDIEMDDIVSMNFFGFQTSILTELKERFDIFLSQLQKDDIKSEFLVPEVVSNMIQEKKATVKVLPTSDRWFGITYQEDKNSVKEEIHKLHEKGIY